MSFSWDTVFSISGSLAMLGWLILIIAPRRHRWYQIPARYVIPGALALAYSCIVMLYFFQSEGGFDSITGVRLLFQDDALMVAGWQHYLAFDLFVGVWIAERSDAIGLSRLLQIPLFAATFMFGPLGLLLFFLIRLFMRVLPASTSAET